MTAFTYLPALPEIFLAAAALILLLIGVLGAPARMGGWIAGLAVLALAVTLLLVLEAPSGRAEAFSGMFATDGFAVFTETLILAAGMAAVLAGLRYNEWQEIDRFELPVLVLFSITGMLAMVTANDLISFYIGLELQSLPLYVLAAFKRDTLRSTEAGLKYFVLSALSSGLLLFGASLLYGFSGGTSYEAIGLALAQPDAATEFGAIVGMVFLVAGLAFKSSAAPFHMWTPDVYEGAPTSVTAFFAAAPKVAALAVLVRLGFGPLVGLNAAWQDIIWVLSAASMILGGYAAISQTNVKRLMAYSSIGHVGYALMGLAAGTEEGVRGLLIYLGIYIVMNIGTFVILMGLGRDGAPAEAISDLAGMSKTRPATAAALAVFMFSMAGIPPTAGVFAKIFVLLPALHAGLYGLAVLGVLMSVVSCFYYLRIVKIMYVDEPAPALDPTVVGAAQRGLIALAVICITLFFVIPGPFIAVAGAAAHTLFP